MHGTTFPKKPSLLTRMKTFMVTLEEKRRQMDSISTHDLETLDPPVWNHRITWLLSLATKDCRESHGKKIKYEEILEDQKKLIQTTPPFNSSWLIRWKMMPRSLQDKIDQVSISFRNRQQGNAYYVKPASHIRRRTSSSLDESSERYSRFMSLSFIGHEDNRRPSKTLKLRKEYNKIQMTCFKRFPSPTHVEFGTEISETVGNEDMNIGFLSSSETETENISDDKIFPQLEDRASCTSTPFPSTEGFQDIQEHESNILMRDMENPNLKYVREILQISGILENDHECFEAWHSLEQPLDPEMFEDLESTQPNNKITDDKNMACYPSHHHKLLFDITNEVLVQIHERTPSSKTFPVGHHLLKDVVLANISRILAMNLKNQNKLEIQMEQDLAKDDHWMDLQVECGHVGLELEDSIFSTLVDEELQIVSSSREKIKSARLALTDVTPAQILTEEAIDGNPTGKTLNIISKSAFEVDDYWRIVEIVHKRLGSFRSEIGDGKSWRVWFNALIVLEHLLTHGPESVAEEFQTDRELIGKMISFQHVDEKGVKWGPSVSKKVERILKLLEKGEFLREERQRARTITRGIQGFGSFCHKMDSATELDDHDDDRIGDDDEDVGRLREEEMEEVRGKFHMWKLSKGEKKHLLGGVSSVEDEEDHHLHHHHRQNHPFAIASKEQASTRLVN